MTKYLKGLAVLGAVALVVTGCGSKPTESNSGSGGNGSKSNAAAKNFRACMVSDSGGFDDKSFNQTSYQGFQDAAKELNIKTSTAESKSDSDYAKNVGGMVDAKCNAIVTVGFKLGDQTAKSAAANPDIKWGIVDYDIAATDLKKTGLKEVPKNVKSLLFDTAQSSFLAGYLAAGTTKTGKVGTFGGLPIPTVTIFMDGYWEGVEYYNKVKKKNVQVLGWSEKTQKGLFTNDFENKAQGKNTASNLISQGADIIFPVAGPAGLGGLQAAKASGGKVNAIWVDTDGCKSAAEYCDVLLTSVYKGMDVAVKDVVTTAAENKFDSTAYVGTLKNDGTGLSPYHQWDSKIPSELKDEVDQLKQDIIDGKITIKSKAQPQSK
ncbi:BMP family lipoprotein [Actinopolymorpha singaporensis]|uniref:Nucleoside-binding protein n=1 Tax=Actinopolymorpha singaporensis TaxID=117157 RepID=A0A1H1SLS2_9ACTN|nr:BMP family ABC transporter substrate-binding protein [Actinopolymorpha singaporensis]SDS48947.1 nucleoside-binding protein [Actinopolymorpha singaporensis]